MASKEKRSTRRGKSHGIRQDDNGVNHFDTGALRPIKRGCRGIIMCGFDDDWRDCRHDGLGCVDDYYCGTTGPD